MIFAALDRWRRPLRAHSNSSARAAKYLRPGKRYSSLANVLAAPSWPGGGFAISYFQPLFKLSARAQAASAANANAAAAPRGRPFILVLSGSPWLKAAPKALRPYGQLPFFQVTTRQDDRTAGGGAGGFDLTELVSSSERP